MPERCVLSVSTKPEIRERLGRLAKETRRSKSFLANEAIERYLDAEERFVTSINKGLAETDAGKGSTTVEILERASQKYLGKSYNPQRS